jgi:hypothetical protein
MTEPTNWLVYDKYEFSLLPGEARVVEGASKSYFEYMNGRAHETGKNLLCIQFLFQGIEQGLKVDEPFGGCGVFAIAIQELLKPEFHRIGEIDEECVKQLRHSLDRYHNLAVKQEDAHETIGRRHADVFVCDFPFFTINKLKEGLWQEEMLLLTQEIKPRHIIVTDGLSHFWHFNYPRLRARGYEDATEDRGSYAKVVDRFFGKVGYRVESMAWHGSCFYYRLDRLENEPVGPIRLLNVKAGEGVKGLRKVG